MEFSCNRNIFLKSPKEIRLWIIIICFICPFSFFGQVPAPTDTTNAPVASKPATIDTIPKSVAIDTTTKPTAIAPPTTKPNVAKNSKLPLVHKKFEATFDSTLVELNPKVPFISNIIKVKNTNGSPKEFYLEVLCPNDWIVLTASNSVRTLNPGDSLFIPIRVIPSKKSMHGGAQYFINVFVISTDGNQLANAFFQVSKPSLVNWQMDILPKPRIYFLNNQFQAPFGVSLSNNGDEKHDVTLSISQTGEFLTIKNKDKEVLKKTYYDFALSPAKDTTFNFFADVKDVPRNFRTVDIDNHNPALNFEPRKYTVYIKAIEPKMSINNSLGVKKKTNLINLNRHIDFIRLRDNIKINNYGSAVIPLIFESNFYDILGVQPIATTLFRANSQIDQYSGYSFYLQNTFTYYSLSKNTYRQTSIQLGYYNRNLVVQAGSVGGFIGIGGMGGTGGGKGVAASYTIKNSLISAFYTRSNQFFYGAEYQNYGLGYRINPIASLQLSTGITRRESLKTPSDYTNIFLNGSYVISKISSFHFGYGLGISRDSISFPSQRTRYGHAINAGFSNSFLNGRLSQAISANYFDVGDINYTNKNYGINLSHRFFPKSQKYSLSLNNNYYNSNYQYGAYSDHIISFTNQFAFSKKIYRGGIAPGLFYNYYEQTNIKLHFRGVSLNYYYFNQEKNSRVSCNVLGGYNNYIDSVYNRELFGLQFFGMLQWHTFRLNMAYNYGPTNIAVARSIIYGAHNYPQSFRLSVNYEYLFKDRRFLINLPLSYSYNNLFSSHTVSFNPQFYFYSYNGWRFRFDVNYAYSKSSPHGMLEYTQNSSMSNETLNNRPNVNQTFTLGAGIRKEFGIPIPKKWSKKSFLNAKFKAFLDFNGNHIIDPEEVPLENIVIHIGDDEVLTNDKGEGLFQNIPMGRYSYAVFPLEDLGGWFYQHDDSLLIDGSKTYFIPFSRGIKVFGSVVVDREKISSDIQKDLDISHFKISVIDTTGKTLTALTDSKGEFAFYVPYGIYVLSIDESSLGDAFTVAQNDISVELSEGMDNYYNSFYLIEKRRKIKKKKFGPDGKVEIIEEDGDGNKINTPTNPRNYNVQPGKLSPAAQEHTLDSLITVLNTIITSNATRVDEKLIIRNKIQNIGTELNKTFTVQLETLAKGKTPQGALDQLVKANKTESKITDNGETLYTTGNFKNIKDAEDECLNYRKNGFRNAKIIKH